MQQPSRLLEPDRLILVLVGLFVLIAGTYSITTPLFEMSDELWHYPMVKTLADGNGLPIQDPENVGPWRQQGSQPPLYYAIGAGLTFWIDTSDMPDVRRENPHVDNGLITEDGNINLIVHNQEREQWPWHGTVLAVHVVRFFSILCAAVTVFMTYQIGREVFPEQRWLSLSAAAVVAFTPMFVFISAAVNNDNLAVMLATISLWIMLRIARTADERAPTLRLAIVLGFVLGLATLSKASTFGYIGLAGVTMAYAALRRKRWQTFFIEGPIIIAIIAALSGWWFWRNWTLYGDPLGLNVFVAILGERARDASLAQLWGERFSFLASYWGLFGGVNVPMWDWVYRVFNWLVPLSMIGGVAWLGLEIKRTADEGQPFDPARWFPLALTLLAILAVIAPLAGSWARNTWSSQGRLVFASIASISMWFVIGLTGWLPQRSGEVARAALVGGLAVLTILAPFAFIGPAYQPPGQIEPGSAGEAITFMPADQAAMRLGSAHVLEQGVRPGGTVR
ncbi:MAG: glycosyltransferase family 39 protein, partial [Chloroflexi bacterium]|nr:glycosyltransferase family 39 protein [Chloroflexota bacterium]